MATSAHTPRPRAAAGPWYIAEDPIAGRIGITSDERVVVYAPYLAQRATGIATKTDARLIAAAPDLLAALKEARAELYSLMHPCMSEAEFLADPTIKAIDAAIAKAEGR